MDEFYQRKLILRGDFIGIDNYLKLGRDGRFGRALVTTGWFVLFTVVPGTFVGVILRQLIASGVKG